jgi:hypothetical protein
VNRILLGIYMMFTALACGWAAWLTLVTQSRGALLLVVLLVILGGTGSALAIRPLFRVLIRHASLSGPLPASGRLVLCLAATVTLMTVAGSFAVHSRVPLMSGERTAATMSDGRHVLMSHGQVIRDLTSEEYKQITASGLASIATVGNLVLTGFLLCVAGGLVLVQRNAR